MDINPFSINRIIAPDRQRQLMVVARDSDEQRPDSATDSDTVVISEEGMAALEESEKSEASAKQNAQRHSIDAEKLTETQKETVRGLQSRDREVRAHEQAYKSAAGASASRTIQKAQLQMAAEAAQAIQDAKQAATSQQTQSAIRAFKATDTPPQLPSVLSRVYA